MLRHRIAVVAVGALLLIACEASDEGAPADGNEGVVAPTTPYDASAEMRPDLLVIEPDEVRPGERVELHFPEETERGIAFVLEEQTEASWALRYFLSAAPSPLESHDFSTGWRSADEAGHGHVDWPAIGIGGPGPDYIEIPDTAEPGEYRVCTANAGDEFCAPIRIVG